MKKSIRTIIAVLIVALAMSFASCEVSEKTINRRLEYKEQIASYVADVQDDYTADNWGKILDLVVVYKAKIEKMAATSRMEECVAEFVSKASEIKTIAQIVKEKVDALDTRIAQTINVLQLDATGIDKIEYNPETNKALFYIDGENVQTIRTFGDNSQVITLFQSFFTDVKSAVVSVGDQSNTITGDELHGNGLKAIIGAKFVSLLVSDYKNALMTELDGKTASCQIVLDIEGIDESECGVELSCEFVG